ncbi:MAG: D-aminoacyl-tRNA deacylase [Bacillota bacterium]
MKVCVQRVKRAEVRVDSQVVASIGKGLLVLAGVCRGDDHQTAARMARKVAMLRVFEDQVGKMNLNVYQVGGSVLVVSQFTLCADCTGGHRPSFSGAMPADEARPIYDTFVRAISAMVPTQQGVFGASMEVELVNDGPVTLVLESGETG